MPHDDMSYAYIITIIIIIIIIYHLGVFVIIEPIRGQGVRLGNPSPKNTYTFTYPVINLVMIMIGHEILSYCFFAH